MSKRPIAVKKINRTRKKLRHTPKAFFDLIAWLKLHGYAQTTGHAQHMILNHRVRHESHSLGITTVKHPITQDEINLVERYQPVELRERIEVI